MGRYGPPVRGKVVVVTGAASGIGRAAVERLARDGARVVAADRAQIDGMGDIDAAGDAVGCVADVATEEGTGAMAATALARFGRLDGLVLNAGVGSAGPVDTEPIEDLDR